jgi:hypothetical protein
MQAGSSRRVSVIDDFSEQVCVAKILYRRHAGLVNNPVNAYVH